jgi:serine/threonine protein kinase
MGTVYLAERADAQYEKQVAIKLVRPGCYSESIIDRFRHERQILAGLDHPNIAKLLDGGTSEDGLPYFVMDFIEGLPIDEYCDQRQLSITERLGLFRTVCLAVQYAHRNLIVHRDLKPSNILVTADGVPRLLDFGIARIINPVPSSDAAETTATLRLMTLEYASPEQVRGEPITTASDIYSLGVLLYRLLTGHSPYRSKSRLASDRVQAICEEEPENPSTAIARRVIDEDGNDSITPESVSRHRSSQPDKLRRRLAGDPDNIVLMALRKEPERRYASVEQFSEDIRRHLEGLPVIARKDTLGYRAGKFIQRHKAGVAAAALILIILLAGIEATGRQARLAERRFDDVRKLANSLLFEVHSAIENLPGATSARELLTKRALEYLDKLAAEAGDDPQLQRELAAAYESAIPP